MDFKRTAQDSIEPVSKKLKTEPKDELQALVDSAEQLPESMDLTNTKRTILRFERALTKNQELRIKYPGDPYKFMESEVELNQQIKLMMGISSSPELYPHLLDSLQHLLTCLSHENMDIVLATIDLINEWTDEDVVSAESSKEAEQGMKQLVDALNEMEIPKLLIHRLETLDEEIQEEKQGVFQILSIIENMCSINTEFSQIVANTGILNWLCNRIQGKGFDSNRQYSGEILTILLQDSVPNRIKVVENEGIDLLLRAVSYYKKRDPQSMDEVEMMENFFDALVAILAEPLAKNSFLECQGIELMLLMIREKQMSRISAIKVLASLVSGIDYQQSALKLIELGGLSALFPLFMQKGYKKLKLKYKDFSESQDQESVLVILVGLFKATHSVEYSELRLRLIAKFCENEFEKLQRLLDSVILLEKRMDLVVQKISVQQIQWKRMGMSPDAIDTESYLLKLDAGLYMLQLIDQIILFLVKDVNTGDLAECVFEKLDSLSIDYKRIQNIVKEYNDQLEEVPLVKRDGAATQTVEAAASSFGNSVQNALLSMGGLDIWTNIAKSLRLTLTVGNAPTVLNGPELTRYLTPLIVFASFILVFAFGALITGLSLCFCCPNALSRQKSPYNPGQKCCSMFLYLLSIFAILATVLTGLKANAVFSVGFSHFGSSLSMLMYDLGNYSVALPSAVTNSVKNVKISALDLVGQTVIPTAVSNVEFDPQIRQTMDDYMSKLYRLEAKLAQIQALNASLNSNVDNCVAYAQNVVANYQRISDLMSIINSPISDGYGGTFQLATFIQPSTFTLSTEVFSIAGSPFLYPRYMLNLLSYSNFPNMTKEKVYRESVLNNLTDTIGQFSIGNGTNQEVYFYGSRYWYGFKTALNNSDAEIASTYISSKLNALAKNGSEIAIPVANFISNEENLRSLIFAGTFAVCIMFCVFMTCFFAFRAPKSMKTLAVISNYKWFIFFLLSLVFLLASVISSEACIAAFNSDQKGWSVILNTYNALGSSLNASAISEIKRKCDRNQSPLPAMSALLSINNTGLINYNLTRMLSNQTSTNTVLDALYNTYFDNSYYAFTEYYSYFTSLPGTVSFQLSNFQSLPTFDTSVAPAISSNDRALLTAYEQVIISLKSSVNVNSFAYTPASGVTLTTLMQQNMLNTFNGYLDELLAKIDLFLNLNANNLISILEGSRNSVQSQIQNIVPAANDVANFSSIFASAAYSIQLSLGQGLTNGKNAGIPGLVGRIPKLQSDIKTAQQVYENATSCLAIAADLNGLQEAFCNQMQTGLDGLWLSFFVMALTGWISVMTFTSAANSLADVDNNKYKKGQVGDSYLSRKSDRRRNKSSRESEQPKARLKSEQPKQIEVKVDKPKEKVKSGQTKSVKVDSKKVAPLSVDTSRQAENDEKIYSPTKSKGWAFFSSDRVRNSVTEKTKLVSATGAGQPPVLSSAPSKPSSPVKSSQSKSPTTTLKSPPPSSSTTKSPFSSPVKLTTDSKSVPKPKTEATNDFKWSDLQNLEIDENGDIGKQRFNSNIFQMDEQIFMEKMNALTENSIVKKLTEKKSEKVSEKQPEKQRSKSEKSKLADKDAKSLKSLKSEKSQKSDKTTKSPKPSSSKSPKPKSAGKDKSTEAGGKARKDKPTIEIESNKDKPTKDSKAEKPKVAEETSKKEETAETDDAVEKETRDMSKSSTEPVHVNEPLESTRETQVETKVDIEPVKEQKEPALIEKQLVTEKTEKAPEPEKNLKKQPSKFSWFRKENSTVSEKTVAVQDKPRPANEANQTREPVETPAESSYTGVTPQYTHYDQVPVPQQYAEYDQPLESSYTGQVDVDSGRDVPEEAAYYEEPKVVDEPTQEYYQKPEPVSSQEQPQVAEEPTQPQYENQTLEYYAEVESEPVQETEPLQEIKDQVQMPEYQKVPDLSQSIGASQRLNQEEMASDWVYNPVSGYENQQSLVTIPPVAEQSNYSSPVQVSEAVSFQNLAIEETVAKKSQSLLFDESN